VDTFTVYHLPFTVVVGYVYVRYVTLVPHVRLVPRLLRFLVVQFFTPHVGCCTVGCCLLRYWFTNLHTRLYTVCIPLCLVDDFCSSHTFTFVVVIYHSLHVSVVYVVAGLLVTRVCIVIRLLHTTFGCYVAFFFFCVVTFVTVVLRLFVTPVCGRLLRVFARFYRLRHIYVRTGWLFYGYTLRCTHTLPFTVTRVPHTHMPFCAHVAGLVVRCRFVVHGSTVAYAFTFICTVWRFTFHLHHTLPRFWFTFTTHACVTLWFVGLRHVLYWFTWPVGSRTVCLRLVHVTVHTLPPGSLKRSLLHLVHLRAGCTFAGFLYGSYRFSTHNAGVVVTLLVGSRLRFTFPRSHGYTALVVHYTRLHVPRYRTLLFPFCIFWFCYTFCSYFTLRLLRLHTTTFGGYTAGPRLYAAFRFLVPVQFIRFTFNLCRFTEHHTLLPVVGIWFTVVCCAFSPVVGWFTVYGWLRFVDAVLCGSTFLRYPFSILVYYDCTRTPHHGYLRSHCVCHVYDTFGWITGLRWFPFVDYVGSHLRFVSLLVAHTLVRCDYVLVFVADWFTLRTFHVTVTHAVLRLRCCCRLLLFVTLRFPLYVGLVYTFYVPRLLHGCTLVGHARLHVCWFVHVRSFTRLVYILRLRYVGPTTFCAVLVRFITHGFTHTRTHTVLVPRHVWFAVHVGLILPVAVYRLRSVCGCYVARSGSTHSLLLATGFWLLPGCTFVVGWTFGLLLPHFCPHAHTRLLGCLHRSSLLRLVWLVISLLRWLRLDTFGYLLVTGWLVWEVPFTFGLVTLVVTPRTAPDVVTV